MIHEKFISTFMKLPPVIRLFTIAMSINLLIGYLITVIEPITFKTLFDGIWWAIVTSATVGYGDLIPKTILGKSLTILLILTGAGFMTYYITFLAQMVVQKQQERLAGKANYYGVTHMIIVGWNERTRKIVDTIDHTHTNQPIVLIDESLTTSPLSTVHFIKGISFDDHVLGQANIQQAKTMMITADHNVSETMADMKTIMTIIAGRGLNPSLRIVAEILSPSQKINANRAGVDHIIETTSLTSKAFTPFIS